MRLDKEEIDLFYKLYYSLLVYVNDKCEFFPEIKSIEDIKGYSIDDIEKLREELYARTEYFEYFICENPFDFNQEELDIVESWIKFVKKTFYVMAYLKKHTIFLDILEPPKAYGVFSFATSFKDMLDSKPPVMVDAILLPFKNKIIFDHILIPYALRINKNVKSILSNAYHDATTKYGIITELTEFPKEKVLSPVKELKFYLKDAYNRELYKFKIERMINGNPSLQMNYHRELGKIFARSKRKDYIAKGLKGKWMGHLEGNIVFTGEMKEEVTEKIVSLVPKEKLDLVYIFKV